MRATSFKRLQKEQDLLEKSLLSILLGFFFFFTFYLAWLIGFQIWYIGRIFPGVSLAGVDVGGMNPAQAASAIASNIQFPENGQILLTDREKTWTVKPIEMGLILDSQASAETAFRYGRSGGIFRRLAEQISARQGAHSLSPNLVLDQRLAYHYLSTLAEQVNQSLLEPSISVEGTNVIINPGQVGRTLDIQTTLDRLTVQLETLQNGTVPLAVSETQPTIVDVNSQADLVRKILSEPLAISLPQGQEGAGPWVLQPSDLAAMLVFERGQDGGNTLYKVAVDAGKLRSFLSDLAPQLQLEPSDARFIFNDETRQLDLIQPAVIGRKLDLENSVQQIQQKVLLGEHAIPLQLVLTTPRITSDRTAEQLGITELLHAETSYFYGSSADRVQNIQAAASRFHWLLVAPGETFSMTSALGDISLDNGYAEALIIYGDQTIMGVGGGVCQVSTTLFRAAFFTGFPVVERHEHAYRVGYYERTAGYGVDPNLAGLDATVFAPLVDLKFVNDSPNWLLMETYVSPSSSSITWKFYSTSDGRSVQWDTTGPTNTVPAPEPVYRENPDLPSGEVEQVDWPAEGADITVTRRVYQGDTLLFQDEFQTHYQPWQAVYEYGPGTEGLPPADAGE